MKKSKLIELNYFNLIVTCFIPVVIICSNLMRYFEIYLPIKYYFFYAYMTISSFSILIYFKEIFKMPKKIIIPAIIFLIIAFLSCLFSDYPKASILGNSYYYGYLGYLAFFGIFVSSITLKKERRESIIKLIVIISTVIAIFSLLRNNISYILFNISKLQEYYFYQGPFYHFNHYGYYLLISTICSIYLFLNSAKKWKIIYFIISSILIFTLIINDTFSVYLAFLFAIIFITIYQIKQHKDKSPILIIIVFILFSLVINRNGTYLVKRNILELIGDVNTVAKMDKNNIDKIGTYRGLLWKTAGELWLKKPIIGYGVDNLKYEYSKYNIPLDKPHNFILELLTSTGIIGTISYLIAVGSILFYSTKNLKKLDKIEFISLVICLSYFISAFFANSRIYTSPYLYIFLGILGSFCIRSIKNEN